MNGTAAMWVLLGALVMLLSCCAKPQLNVIETLTVQAGEHRSTPWHYEWKRTSYRAYEFQFTPSCLYNYRSRDQCDWLKLTGDATNWITNHQNSGMVAYRQPDTLVAVFQLAPYYHKDGITYHPQSRCTVESHVQDPDLPEIWVTPWQPFQTHSTIVEDQDFMNHYVVNMETGAFYMWDMEFDEFERTREIGWYVGGDTPAPHTMYLTRMLIAEN